MDDLLQEFLTETAENLDVVDVEIVKLEQDPNNREVLSNIFRLVHTIKGTCGFLGLPRLEAVAHAGENVLGKFRAGEMEVTEDAVSLILEAIDAIKAILKVLGETEQEPPGNDAAIISRLDDLAEGRHTPAPASAPAPALVVPTMPPRALKPGEVSLDELEAAFQMAPGPDAIAAGAAPLLS
ncbi:Hpt domain-containing protein, partial [Zavarzinia sp.]|uniref:Hpt domain-containing protein n=1 Tax=Zavarzinia sp. TaxID=2027920 RepID=UPI003BB61F99